MSEALRPRPRAAAAPDDRPRPMPHTGPRPAPVAKQHPRPGSAGGRSRADRRRAERTARLRRVGQGLAGLVVVAVVAAVAVLIITGPDDHSAAARTAGPHRPAPGGADAELADPQLVAGYLAAARIDIAAVTSYDYRHLHDALTAGVAVTTGEYRTAYEDALTGALATAAGKNHTVQKFTLLEIGAGSFAPDRTSAKVLIFGAETITERPAATAGKSSKSSKSSSSSKTSKTSTSSKSDPVSRTSLVTLTATLVHRGSSYLISSLDAGTNAGLPASTRALTVAAEAGREEVVDLLTYRYEHFDVDYNRALDGAAEPLHSQIAGNAADTKSALTRGQYDLSGAVTAVAVERASGDTVVLLMAATGTKVTTGSAPKPVTDGRYEVTVVRIGGAWKTSDVDPVETD